jgi:hypothetical protein
MLLFLVRQIKFIKHFNKAPAPGLFRWGAGKLTISEHTGIFDYSEREVKIE